LRYTPTDLKSFRAFLSGDVLAAFSFALSAALAVRRDGSPVHPAQVTKVVLSIFGANCFNRAP